MATDNTYLYNQQMRARGVSGISSMLDVDVVLNLCVYQANILTEGVCSERIVFAFMSIPLPSIGNAILSQEIVLAISKQAFDHEKMCKNLHISYYSMYTSERFIANTGRLQLLYFCIM